MQSPAPAEAETAEPSSASSSPSFESFFEAESERLFRGLYLMTGNPHEAEEVMQDAFITVWERWDRVSAMESPTGYGRPIGTPGYISSGA